MRLMQESETRKRNAYQQQQQPQQVQQIHHQLFQLLQPTIQVTRVVLLHTS